MMPRFIEHRSQRRTPSEDECFACGEPVRHGLRLAAIDGAAIAIRCADCLRVFCLGCSYKHFGLRPPPWLRSTIKKVRGAIRTVAARRKRRPKHEKKGKTRGK